MPALENPFLNTLKGFNTDVEALKNKESNLLEYRDALILQLENLSLGKESSGLSKKSELSSLSESLNKIIHQSIKSWTIGWEDSSPMRSLSDQYNDRIILLVFGKVNAGKSSFCNYMVEQFDQNEVKRFYLKDGSVHYTKDKFSEGVVETTARIQGVELGNHFVLLDSPGLHSVTDKNGDLTKVFTDSADAVLWLTPSTSPGQVQELQDLKLELETRKPLLPIITRSDIFVEDIDDNDEIIKVLENKSPDNRRMQECDVKKRAEDSLEERVRLKQPISISVHAFKQSSGSQDDQRDAGLTQVFESLVSIMEEAKAYKVNKASQQILNYLDKDVLHALNNQVIPEVTKLAQLAQDKIDDLKIKKKSISVNLTADVCAQLPDLIEQFKNQMDLDGLSKSLNSLIEHSLNEVLQQELRDYIEQLEHVACNLSPDTLGDFENITIDITQVTGSSGSSFTAAAGGVGGAIGGAELGAFVGTFAGPIGTMVGGALGGIFGGFFGSAAGSAAGEAMFLDTEVIKEHVGIDSNKVLNQTSASIKKKLPVIVDSVINDVIASINATKQFSMDVNKCIAVFESKVIELKEIK